MNTLAIIAIVLIATILIGIISLIHYSVVSNRENRLRKEIFKPGNTVKLYECLNEDFGDYEEYDAFTIDAVINTTARIRRKGKNDYDYNNLSFIGNCADLIKVYGEDGHLVGKYKHKTNVISIQMYHLVKIN